VTRKKGVPNQLNSKQVRRCEDNVNDHHQLTDQEITAKLAEREMTNSKTDQHQDPEKIDQSAVIENVKQIHPWQKISPQNDLDAIVHRRLTANEKMTEKSHDHLFDLVVNRFPFLQPVGNLQTHHIVRETDLRKSVNGNGRKLRNRNSR
jgi:hypothetical protein